MKAVTIASWNDLQPLQPIHTLVVNVDLVAVRHASAEP